jgi:uncharacterized protein YcnI
VRIVPTATVAGALVLGTALPAAGHAELAPWQLPPNSEAGMLLLVTHGCGDDEEWISTEPLAEEPSVAVTIQRPLELEIRPVPYQGWTLTTEEDQTGTVTSATWRSDDPAGTSRTLQLPFDVTVGDVPEGHVIWFPVFQECTAGESLEWTVEGDSRGGDEIPAMRLTIHDDATAPPLHAAGDTGTRPGSEAGPASRSGALERFGLPSLVLALAGTGAVILGYRRRRTSSAVARD